MSFKCTYALYISWRKYLEIERLREKSLHVAMADQMYMYISGYQNITK